MNNNIGLVSISFRQKSAEEIISLCKKNGIGNIEWGGDIHCPPGDSENAKKIAELTKKAGININCYGSYFRLGITPISDFEAVCKTANTIGAPCVRIWAYNKQYCECDEETVQRLTAEAKAVFAIAKEHGLCINFEYHRGSLTQTIDGALQLFDAAASKNLRIHWQPNPEITAEENLSELKKLPRVDIVHVFAWTFENGENVRHPLYNHHLTWQDYIEAAIGKNKNCVFALEFFKDDSEEQLTKDADVLREILAL